MINLSKPPIFLVIGRQGENLYRPIAFDAADWLTRFPDGAVSIVFERPDGEKYPVVVGAVSSPVIWTPSATDTAVSGYGKLELRMSSGDVLGKSVAIQTTTAPSINGDGTAPPPPEPDWTQEVADNAGLAVRAADRAEQSAGLAQGAAEQTAGDRQAVAEDREAVEGQADRAEGQADRAEDEADNAAESATIAANNILNGVSTHNASDAAHADIRQAVQTAESIARGRATAHVFDTYAAMTAWLAVPENVAELVTGDNLYIRDTGVKDYWWDGEGAQELEAEAPDLTDYYTKVQVDAKLPLTVTQSEYDALVATGTTEAGRTYFTV